MITIVQIGPYSHYYRKTYPIMKLKIKGNPGTGNSFSKTRINRVENMCTHAQKVENIHSTTIHLTLNVHMLQLNISI